MILVAAATAVLARPFEVATLAGGVPEGAAAHDKKVGGAALAMVVIAEAADGYRVVFSLGELDKTLGKAAILVPDTRDGKALPDGDGPVRLVAIGETRGARSVKQLVRPTAQ